MDSPQRLALSPAIVKSWIEQKSFNSGVQIPKVVKAQHFIHDRRPEVLPFSPRNTNLGRKANQRTRNPKYDKENAGRNAPKLTRETSKQKKTREFGVALSY
jgi:hypothetical protein